MTELEKQKIGFQSLQEPIDTTNPNGKLVFHVFVAVAKLEHDCRLCMGANRCCKYEAQGAGVRRS
jgi:hypothetical protein